MTGSKVSGITAALLCAASLSAGCGSSPPKEMLQCPDLGTVDGGVTSLDGLPLAELCAAPSGRGLIRWDDACADSIVVVQPTGVDCSKYWLFDAQTKVLQATARGGNLVTSCSAVAPGFLFPSQCFGGNFTTTVSRLFGA